MTTRELAEAVRRLSVETGSLACLGCGHEHSCSVRGCAILREAADALDREASWRSQHKRRVPVLVTCPDGRLLRFGSLTEAAGALGVGTGAVSTAATMGYKLKGYLIRREGET